MLTSDGGVEIGRDRGVGAALRGVGPLGMAAALVVLALGPAFEPFNALVVPVWAWMSGTPWRDLGCAKPRNWALTLAAGIVFGAVLKFAMKAVVMPLLGAPPTNAAFHYLVGNTSALSEMMFVVIVGAGWGEESVFRGFLFERLRKLLGSSVGATVTMVLLSAALFGPIHYLGQGLAGAEQATIFGILFATVFALTHDLWFLVAAHAAFDITAVLIIYLNAETSIAHLLFR